MPKKTILLSALNERSQPKNRLNLACLPDFRALTIGLASIALFLMVSVLSISPALAAESDAQLISKLEVKFFQHDYPKDTMSSRIERLEQMIFGETKQGSDSDRVTNLVAAVPNAESDTKANASDASGKGSSGGNSNYNANSSNSANSNSANSSYNSNSNYSNSANSSGGNSGSGSNSRASSYPSSGGGLQKANRDDSYEPIAGGSEYPAVTAMEKKVFGKDYANENVIKRLERLETKAFGKASASDDLSERVDRLKSATGVDLARQPPAGSDWAEEDEMGGNDITYYPPESSSRQQQYKSADGEDGRSFSGRDLREDMRKSFSGYGSRSYAGQSGTYGSGAVSPSTPSYAPGRGTYPRNALSKEPMPASDFQRGGSPMPAGNLGLSQQVALLEKEIFGKTHTNDTIPERLSRLETTVFAQQKPAVDKAIPERVSRLLSAVPLSNQNSQIATRNNRGGDSDFAELDAMDDGFPKQKPPKSGGLGKIINGLGSLLTGGFVGGYPYSGNLVTDPQSGLLYDPYSGSYVDPMTGVVIQRSVQSYGTGGFNSFNNGFSPMSPYGGGYGMGSTGMHFGFGSGGVGLGGMGMGAGMWP